ncbi:MAG: DUF481 domain-containing protein [Tepidisphaeraceae bacterium]
MLIRIFIVCVVLASACFVRADEVVLKNGDKLNGKVGQIAGGKMSFSSPVLGDITIDMGNVTSFKTDEPATIRLKGKQPPVTDKIASGDSTKFETVGGAIVDAAEVKVFNPPPEKWSGSLIGNFSLRRGNTDTLDVGVAANAVLRRITEKNDDRTTFAGAYNLGTTGTGDSSATTTDNWMALAKYDRFWTEKLYGFGLVKVEHDRIADLYVRLAPGVGLGYQWYETPDFNFNTEAGVSYVYENYNPGPVNDFISPRLAYHVDKKFNDKVTVFHDLEYLPSFEDPGGDFLLNADAGIRAMLTKSFFAQFTFVWNYDSEPAPGRDKSDLTYLLGVGWQF